MTWHERQKLVCFERCMCEPATISASITGRTHKATKARTFPPSFAVTEGLTTNTTTSRTVRRMSKTRTPAGPMNIAVSFCAVNQSSCGPAVRPRLTAPRVLAIRQAQAADLLQLKVSRPAKGKQVSPEIVATHDLFKIISTLQVGGQTADPPEIVINRSGDQGPSQRPEIGGLAADFSHSCTPEEVAGQVDPQVAIGLGADAGLPHAIDRLIAPSRRKRLHSAHQRDGRRSDAAV